MSGKTSMDFLADILNNFGWAWWIKVITKTPCCTYLFGPFVTHAEARKAQEGFLEDLRLESAEELFWEIKRFKPDAHNLTVDRCDEVDNSMQRLNSALAIAALSSLATIGLLVWS